METKKTEIKNNGIDPEVLEQIKQDNILVAISDEKQMRRAELNCFAEFLGEIQNFSKKIDELNSLISVTSADKIKDFFKNVQANTAEEAKKVEIIKKIKKSHLKSEN